MAQLVMTAASVGDGDHSCFGERHCGLKQLADLSEFEHAIGIPTLAEHFNPPTRRLRDNGVTSCIQLAPEFRADGSRTNDDYVCHVLTLMVG